MRSRSPAFSKHVPEPDNSRERKLLIRWAPGWLVAGGGGELEPGLPTPSLQFTLAFRSPQPEASEPGPLSTAWSPVVGPRPTWVRAWEAEHPPRSMATPAAARAALLSALRAT